VTPDSLVFVAIVAVWVAYLLPQWLRRRDNLSQARGHDRFSHRLRLLVPRRRTVAEPVQEQRRSTASLLSGATDHRRAASAASGTPAATATTTVVTPAPAPGAAVASDVGAAVGATRPADPRHEPAVSPLAPSAARRASRRRARVLLALVVLTGIGWALTALAMVPLWAGAPMSALLGLDLLALVASGRARARRNRIALADHRRRAADRRAGEAADAARRARVERASDRRQVAAPAAEPDLVASMADDDGTWVPVPVPPPTYTMKAYAPRPEPAPLTPTASTAATVPAPPAAVPTLTPDEAVQELDLDAVLERRRAVNG
jgi:hypothetical protein